MRYLGLGLCHTEITPKKVDLRRKGSLKMRYNTRLVVYCHIYTGGVAQLRVIQGRFGI